MKIRQIRNATLKIEYAGKIFLIDPWLIGKRKFGSFSNIPNLPFHVVDPVKWEIPMPIFDLPDSLENILEGVDYYLITHVHPDHIDMNPNGTVGEFLDKNIPVLVQDETDAEILKKSDFKNVNIIGENIFEICDIKITKTPALHGKIKPMCNACGIIFQSENEKTVYVAGDTVWFNGVKKTLQKFNPDVVVVNGCAAEFVEYGRLIMNDEDIECVAKTSPHSDIFITHMDNVPHASITRNSMRGFLAKRGIKNYFMPEDGETLEF